MKPIIFLLIQKVIELLINNQTSENLKQVKIEAIEYPDWVKIANKEVIMMN